MDLFQFGIFKRDQIQNMLLSIGCDAHELNSVPTKRARKWRKNVLGHKSDDVSDTLLDAAGQETRCKENEQNFLFQLDDMRVEVSRREQEIMQMATKMKTLEEQHQDYQKHIAVLKESLCAKEEHYTMLQTDVSSAHHMANRKVKGEGASKGPIWSLIRTDKRLLSDPPLFKPKTIFFPSLAQLIGCKEERRCGTASRSGALSVQSASRDPAPPNLDHLRTP